MEGASGGEGVGVGSGGIAKFMDGFGGGGEGAGGVHNGIRSPGRIHRSVWGTKGAGSICRGIKGQVRVQGDRQGP